MMGTPLAVQGCTFKVTQATAAGTVPATYSGTLSTSTQPSQDIAVNGRGVYFGSVDVTVPSGTTVTAAVPGTTGTGVCQGGTVTINGTGTNVLEGGTSPAVLKGDAGTGSVDFVFTTTTTPASTISVPCVMTVEVDDPGQTDVEAS